MSLVTVNDVVDSLADQTVTRRRYASGSFSTTVGSKGLFVQGAATDTSILAVIGPITGRTRKELPEGVRLTGRFLMHTTADVRGSDPMATASATEADHVLYDGHEYEVIEDERWVGHGAFRRFILAETTAEV